MATTVRLVLTVLLVGAAGQGGQGMNESVFRCELEIQIVHQRFGKMICPDIWVVVVPTPAAFANGVWSNEILPWRNHG